MTATPTARGLCAVWTEFYAEWEAGTACSPSATDLAEAAVGFFGWSEIDPSDVADVIFDRQLHGDNLFDIAVVVMERWS